MLIVLVFHLDFARVCRNNQDGETFVRTLSDCWVVGKKSDQREMVVVINQKNLNLIEVNGQYCWGQRYINLDIIQNIVILKKEFNRV